MLGLLSCVEVAVLFGVISSSLNMSTGINFFLRRLAGVMALVIATALSTTTTPPARTTSPKGQDAYAGCPRVVKGRCGTLESCVVILHLVKSREKVRASLDRQTDRVEVRVRDPVLIVLDFH